ncbi:hypothetical protein ACIOJD_06575 [Streptomyces sp. NPDC088116]|uniref:hypothetical protein n=1 Tax=Streptomyces sp. NPDC088116 TaxID=3365825 RepID=UPI0038289FE0
MKSLRSRMGVGLAVAAAAVAVPLTATTASATPPPGDGWVISGGWKYPSKEACEAEELPYAQQNGYKEVWCDGEPNTVYQIWVR